MYTKLDNHSNKKILVRCPYCKKERWVRLDHYRQSKLNGVCFSCYNKKQTNPSGLSFHDGYVFVKYRNHPRANAKGKIKRAILVMESKLGRCLLQTEHVHHINGIRSDDNPENLMIVSNSEHARLHRKMRPNLPFGGLTKERNDGQRRQRN